MPVYVDPLRSCVPSKRWPWRRSCHLFADSTAELHHFARKMGLKPHWFQDDRRLPHFDLTPGMRCRAVELGAVEVDLREVAQRMTANRAKHKGAA